jgi:sugar O-acyltransferase (sialic acid O-acetyltransferase NeuD family)
MKTKKLVIIGTGETADIAYEYFMHDSPYEVVAFSVNKEFINQKELYGLPVVEFEVLENLYPKDEYELFVAISYIKLNRVRKKMFDACKAKGYTCASYISSRAFVWHNAEIGENSFVFENNVIQHKVCIGNNVIIWSGNHIGHQTVIEDHVYISSHAVISGFCRIGESSFIGVNSTFNDNIFIAEDTIVGSAALIVKNFTERGRLLIGAPAKEADKTSYESFNVFG